MNLPASVSVFYGRRFAEAFFKAMGTDVLSLEKSTLGNTCINEEIDGLVVNAGVRAGLEARNRFLGGSYAT
jgi:hypothetical protein